MEKKKLLLVAISVGIFLVIAIGAAILVFTPKNAAIPSAAATNSPAAAGSSGTTASAETSVASSLPGSAAANSAPDSSGTVNSPSPDIDPVAAVRNGGTLPGWKPSPQGSYQQDSDYHIVDAPSSEKGKSNDTVIRVNKPTTAAVPSVAPASKAAPSPKPAPQAAKTEAPSSAKPAAAKPAAPAKSQTTTKPKVRNDFWVQTGAFSTATSAEGVKDTLAAKGIKSIIDNRDVNGTTLFRVRVGPYTSKNEADYWLSLIKSIDGFENSQVRQTQTLQ